MQVSGVKEYIITMRNEGEMKVKVIKLLNKRNKGKLNKTFTSLLYPSNLYCNQH